MEINKIYNEDCLNALSKIPDNSIVRVIGLINTKHFWLWSAGVNFKFEINIETHFVTSLTLGYPST